MINWVTFQMPIHYYRPSFLDYQGSMRSRSYLLRELVLLGKSMQIQKINNLSMKKLDKFIQKWYLYIITAHIITVIVKK